MKRCNECLEEVEMYADEIAELCEHCVADLENREHEVSRDWNKDKLDNLIKRCETAKAYGETIAVDPDAVISLIQQYAAEKERADRAEEREQMLSKAMSIVMYSLSFHAPKKEVVKICEKVSAVLYPLHEMEGET
ncbi:hypothetical protein D3C87_891540 [compost metagenome]